MQVTVNTKIDSSDKDTFEALVEKMGLTQSVVLRNFIKTFNMSGGFPYDINYVVSDAEAASTSLLEAQIDDGTARIYSSMSELWEELDDV